MAARAVSAGVLVTDGARLLLGHASRSPRWDIPKGGVERGESFAQAASRELAEETGLVAPPDALLPLGVKPYLRNKDLALFAWVLPALPDSARLVCAAVFDLPSGGQLPEFDRFGYFTRDEAMARVGKNLARLLSEISLDALTC